MIFQWLWIVFQGIIWCTFLHFSSYIYIYIERERERCVCVCIYIYIYIYSHPHTDCFVVSQLFSVARHVGSFKLRLKPTKPYVRLSIIPLNHQSTYVSSGIIRHYEVAFVCLHFALPDTGVLNSYEKLCITRVAAVNSFARVFKSRESGAYI